MTNPFCELNDVRAVLVFVVCARLVELTNQLGVNLARRRPFFDFNVTTPTNGYTQGVLTSFSHRAAVFERVTQALSRKGPGSSQTRKLC